ncbi:hypothetical protein ACFJIX_16685 [Roseateles sp. UC29_93]|uniref:hypothetical protein n=1 Tax=Roseateles sp. UC29_93 TaxID=3350177 RepID=UPI00366B3188
MVLFDCIRLHAIPTTPKAHRALIDDRLFRRYLRSSELDVAAEMLRLARVKLSTLPVSSIDWAPEGRIESMLDRAAGDLASLVGRYFEAFDRCSESAKLFLETFNIEQPVRAIRSDTAWFAWEKCRPLEAYEALDGLPFWIECGSMD